MSSEAHRRAVLVGASAGISKERQPGRGVKAAALVLAFGLLLSACSDGKNTQPSASPTPAVTIPAPEPIVTPSPEPSPEPTVASPTTFYNHKDQPWARYEQAVNDGRQSDADILLKIASQPTAVWLGEWDGIQAAAEKARVVAHGAVQAGQAPIFVVYGIPGRDCGLHSAGGVAEQEYLGFVSAIADSVRDKNAWVILEPDALAQMGDCGGQGDRAGLLRGAAKILDEAGARVYLDAGHSNWRGVDDVVSRINQVGTENLTGFSTNVSNYNATANERQWADQIAAKAGLTYIVDTSRNGNGSNGEWCNPRGRKIGERPTIINDGSLDAYVWGKVPGESDGNCNGGPSAGAWWEEVALELAREA